MNRRTYHQLERERGSVVLLVALLVTAFIGLVAIAVDMINYATSLQQSRNFAQLAALSALERYVATSGSESVKRGAALTRANEVSLTNLTLDSKTARSLALNTSISSSSSVGAGQSVLQPGQFFFAAPATGNPCATQGETPPCFVPKSDTETANAFRLIGEFHPQTTLRFASAVLDVSSFSTRVEAIATLVPRHGCFLVDISGSMDNDTHKTKQPTYQYVDRFAFLLKNYPTGDPDNPTLPASTKVHDVEYSNFESSPFQTRPNGNVAGTEHYVDGYSRKGTFNNADYNVSAHGGHHPAPTDQGGLYSIPREFRYRIETDRWTKYQGPEPLGMAVRGINRALQTFKERKVVGDMACMIFYDQTLQWTRVFNLTDDFDYLEKFTEIDLMGDSNRGFDLMIKHKIFPEAFSRTDLKLALTEALRQLSSQANTGIPSSDFIVLIGDGQTNCTSCPMFDSADANGDGHIDYQDFVIARDCYWGDRPFGDCAFMDTNSNGNVDGDSADFNEYLDWMTSCGAEPGCSNELGYHNLSVQEVLSFVETQIAPSRIPIHVMLTGKESGPNTVDVEDPANPGSCLSDSQKRQERNKAGQADNYPSVEGPDTECYYIPNGIGFWNGSDYTWGPTYSCSSSQAGYDPQEAWDNKSEENPYLPVNTELYKLATMTGGIWSPIRPIEENCTVAECIPGTTRFTDPLCREPGEQVFDTMDQILGQNPFTLVVSRGSF